MTRDGWVATLPLVAIAVLVGATLVQSRRSIEEATVARYQSERNALAEVGARALEVSLDAVQHRLSDPVIRAWSGVDAADTPDEIGSSLRRLAGGLPTEEVVFFAHDGEGTVIAVDPAVDAEVVHGMLGHAHHRETGHWDDGTGVCPMCAEELHAVSIVEPLSPTLDDGVFLAANVRLDRVADSVLSSLSVGGDSAVCIKSAGGAPIACRGSADDPKLRTIVPVRGHPITVDAATARAVVVADVAQQTLWMVVVSVSAVVLVGVAAGLALWRERKRRREEVAAVHRMAEIDKLASLGTMAAGVMHEIASPLTVVLGNVDLLDRCPSEEIPAVRRDTLDAIGRIQRIAGDLRGFSRRAGGAVEPFDLRDAVGAAVRLAAPVTKHACVVDVRMPAPMWVEANAQHVTQIVLNLISNAAHALRGRPYPQARVVIAARSAEGRAELSVEDTGPGVPQEHVPKLFSLFFTTKPPGEGTGLGLALSARLAEDSGGKIRYEGGAQGARFVVELPLMDP